MKKLKKNVWAVVNKEDNDVRLSFFNSRLLAREEADLYNAVIGKKYSVKKAIITIEII